MRYVVLSLFALAAGLCVVSRAEDCEEKACCKQAAASCKSACPLSACAAKGDCQASACAKAAACPASACAKKIDCQASACAASGDCCAAEKITHLQQALDHLEAAGMEAEARQVKQALAWETIAQKQRELARLHAEIQELRQAAGPERQVLLHVQLMEVSLAKSGAKGLDLPGTEVEKDPCPCDAQPKVTFNLCDRQAADKFVKKLTDGDHVKVLAAPKVVTVDRRPATYMCDVPADGYTQLDAVPTLLGDNKVRVAIRLRQCSSDAPKSYADFPSHKTTAVHTDFEMQLGQTLVIGGPIDPCASKTSCHDVQTVLLVTPEEVTAQPPLPTAQAPSVTEAK